MLVAAQVSSINTQPFGVEIELAFKPVLACLRMSGLSCSAARAGLLILRRFKKRQIAETMNRWPLPAKAACNSATALSEAAAIRDRIVLGLALDRRRSAMFPHRPT